MNFTERKIFGALALLAAGCSMDRYSSNPSGVTVNNDAAPSDGIAHLSIDADTHYQTLEGFGAAVAWYAESLAAFPSDSPIFDLAFRDLGLDMLRFRNRYGRQDQGSSSDITAEVTILQRATQSLGHLPKILLSSWSPPASLKASGFENCTNNDPNNKTDCTLAKDSSNNFVYDQFADYFVAALNYYATSGIHPDYLSIQNELNYVPNGWEGCYFEPTETNDFPGYDEALSAVRGALASVGNTPKIIGPEAYSLSNGALGSFVTDTTRPMLDGVAHHLYSSNYWRTPDSYLSQMMDANQTAAGLPLFETEFDTQNDGNVAGGFETAWVIHNALAVEGVSTFLYWGLVWGGKPGQTPSGSLLWLVGNQYTIRDQYYAMRHFARFTDPGYERVAAQSTSSDVRVSAYLAPDNSQLTVVMLNTGFNNAQVEIDAVNGFTQGTSELYRTTFVSGDGGTSETWNPLGSLNPNQPLPMPSHSVVTLVLHASASDAGD